MTHRLVCSQSVLLLDAAHPVAARAVIDAQDMHRLVMSGFYNWVEPGAPDARAQMGILSTWTIDLKNNVLLVVVQSKVAPDWAGLPRAALTTPPKVATVDQAITAGQQFTLRAVVSPRSTRPDRMNPDSGRRKLPHTRPDHVRRWTLDRSQPAGQPPTDERGTRRIGADINPATLQIGMLPAVTTSSTDPAHKGLKIGRAEIKAHATVTDPATFLATLTGGLGPGRAYGCGLLLARPA